MNESDKELVERISKLLKSAETPGDDFDNRVMSAVRAEAARTSASRPALRARPRPGFGQWLLAPMNLRISPVSAFAIAAAVLLVVGLLARPFGKAEPFSEKAVAVASPSQRADTVKLVQFVFVAPGAQKVVLVGDFNNWDSAATPLTSEGSPGVWTVSVPLTSGRHQYGFVVDDKEWRIDPNAPKAAEDSYGTPNSVVTVSATS